MQKRNLDQMKVDSGRGKGLDIGTAFMYWAENKNGKVSLRTQRNAFFDIEASDFSKEMLSKAKVRFIQEGDRLYVIGNDAVHFATIFKKETRRPIKNGIISPAEEEALSIVELIAKTIIRRPGYKGEVLYYSVPGKPMDTDFNVLYHEKILQDFLLKLDYSPRPINEAMAVVFSEFESEDFTGFGLSFGAGLVNMCFSYHSVPIFSFSLTRAGDWLDQQVAQAANETASRVSVIKESSLDLTRINKNNKIESALSIYYTHLIEYTLNNIKKAFEETRGIPKIENPIKLALAGGTVLPKGFLERFKQLLVAVDFPFEIGEVQMSSEPRFSVTKGALAAAMAEEKKITREYK